jgi:hypothetical protein
MDIKVTADVLLIDQPTLQADTVIRFLTGYENSTPHGQSL